VTEEDALCYAGLIQELLDALAVLKGAPSTAIVRGGKGERRPSESRKVYKYDPTPLREELAELADRLKGASPTVQQDQRGAVCTEIGTA
jgi:hypothetical protein